MIEWFKPFVSILYVYSCNDWTSDKATLRISLPPPDPDCEMQWSDDDHDDNNSNNKENEMPSNTPLIFQEEMVGNFT